MRSAVSAGASRVQEVRGRPGEGDLARAVRAVRAGAREADERAPREPPQLVGQERRVGGDEADARALAARGRLARERAPDRPAAQHEAFREPEVREHEHADDVLADDARGRADAGRVAERLHADAGADLALGDGAAARVVERACDQLVAGLGAVAQVAPRRRIALADDGDDARRRAPSRLARRQHVRRAVVDGADVRACR